MTVYSLAARSVTLVPGVAYALSDVFSTAASTGNDPFSTLGAAVRFYSQSDIAHVTYPGVPLTAASGTLSAFNVAIEGAPTASTVGNLSSISFVVPPSYYDALAIGGSAAVSSDILFPHESAALNDTTTAQGARVQYLGLGDKTTTVTLSYAGAPPPVPAANWLQTNYNKVIIALQASSPGVVAMAFAHYKTTRSLTGLIAELGKAETVGLLGTLSHLGGILLGGEIGLLDPDVATGTKALHDSITDPNSDTRGLLNQPANAGLRSALAEIDAQRGVMSAQPTTRNGAKDTFSVPVTHDQLTPVDPALGYAELYETGVAGPLFSSVVVPYLGTANTALKVYGKFTGSQWTQLGTASPLQPFAFAAPVSTFLVVGMDASALPTGTAWVSGVAFATDGTFNGSITTLSKTDVAASLGIGAVLGYNNATKGTSGVVAMDDAGAGGPGYLKYQYIAAGNDNTAYSTQAPNVFIRGGGGSDAIQVSSGQNVLDGGLGSNFLTGGSGPDTFFTDARAPGTVWNTVINFHSGDAVTLWGFAAGISSYRWEAALAGAPGAQGATLRANIVGGNGRTGDGIDASVTFAGISVSQAQNLQIVTGSQPAGPYLFIYNPGV